TDYELTNPLNQLTQPTHHYQHPQQLTPTLPDLDLHTSFESVARARSWQWAQFGGDRQLAWLYLAELDLSLQVSLALATRTAQATAHRGRLTWEVLRDRQLRDMLQGSEARDVKLRDFPPEIPWEEVPRRITSEVLTFLAELRKV
ncbi:hypothetical protein, partial [Buchananella hordeovulneris]|uniref:hypothetical protein n=1 Tax=Buchananella hordeovulneris TaxID=52770 RepID=UPI00163B3B3B